MNESHVSAAMLDAYDLVPPVELYALPEEGKNNQSIGVHTGAGDFILKRYTAYGDTASIHYEHRLLLWLAEANLSFAVPAPVRMRSGETLHVTPNGRRSLAPYLPGARLDPADLLQVESFAAALGELQAALRHYPALPRPSLVPLGELRRAHRRIPDPFAPRSEDLRLPDAPPYSRLFDWWREELALLQTFVDGPYRALPWQVIHNDFTPANTLFHRGGLAAVLDFEFAAPDARALDLAMGLRMTMRVWENPEPWRTVEHFCRGYRRWVRLVEAEAEAIPWLIRLRNAFYATWLMGRALRAGDVRPQLWRIKLMQEFVRWLGAHEQQLVDTLKHEAV